MAHSSTNRRRATLATLCLALALAASQARVAPNPPPRSAEGLELKTRTKQRIVYLRPGATFAQYTRLAILDPYIEFSARWLRDYNRSAHHRIADSDLARARADLSVQLKKVFAEELTRGRYRIAPVAAADTLVLRPALVNIEVNAPDLMTPGRTVTYAWSAGQMTLYLELWDSSTNTILARVVDARADSEVYGQRMGRVTNRAAGDRILRAWARELHAKLDLARGHSAAN